MEQGRSRPAGRPEPNRYMEVYEEREYPFKKINRINFFFIYDDILPPPGGLLLGLTCQVKQVPADLSNFSTPLFIQFKNFRNHPKFFRLVSCIFFKILPINQLAKLFSDRRRCHWSIGYC